MSPGIPLALVCALGWGCSYVFVRRGQRAERTSTDAGLFLTIVANNVFTLLVVVGAMATGHAMRPGWMAILWFALGGVVTTYLGRTVVFRAVSRIGPSRADALKVGQPVFTAVLAAIFLSEVFGLRLLGGMVLVMGGVGALVLEHWNEQGPLHVRRGWREGLMLGLLGAFLYGLGNVFRKAGVDAYPSAIAGVAISTFTALLCIVTAFLIRGRGKDLLLALRHPDPDYLMAGVANSIGLFGFFGSVTFLPVAVTTVIASVEPFFTVLASRVLLGRSTERLSLRFFGSAAVIVLGVAVIAVHL